MKRTKTLPNYTPEYSDELLQCVQEIYNNEFKTHYPQLKLEKLIDLLDHSSFLFETYTKSLRDSHFDDALSAFIVGSFYMYFIIPQSTQFLTKNRHYRMYHELKNLYEDELNMTNVLSMVKTEITKILDSNYKSQNESSNNLFVDSKFIRRERAFSVPNASNPFSLMNDTSLDSQLDNSMDTLNTSSTTVLSNKGTSAGPSFSNNSVTPNPTFRITLAKDANNMSANGNNSNSNSGINSSLQLPRYQYTNEVHSDVEYSIEDTDESSPLWTAPQLDSKNQLKLAPDAGNPQIVDDAYSNQLPSVTRVLSNIRRNQPKQSKLSLNTNTNSPRSIISQTPTSPTSRNIPYTNSHNNNTNSNNNSSSTYIHSASSFDSSNDIFKDALANNLNSKINNSPTNIYNHGLTINTKDVEEDEEEDDFAETNPYHSSSVKEFPRKKSPTPLKSPVDRSVTHRKDSYHSVYMFNDSNEDNNNHGYDETSEYIESLEHIQKQDVITCPELFSLLSNNVEREKVLLIDLRFPERFVKNHIVAPNILQLNPKLLWDDTTNTPVYTAEKLEQIINNPLFSKRDTFKYVVYYSDMKTYMNMTFDYLFTLFYLLVTCTSKPVKSLPTSLLGGYEKWYKVINSYVNQYSITMNDYVYRKDAGASAGRPLNNNEKPKMEIWTPPQLPIRIRKRAPPPPPSSLPKPNSGKMPPPLPPKINLHGNPSLPPIHSPLENQVHSLDTHKQNGAIHRHFSIPILEKSENDYVSLSITGLRNLGNTCYINSMLQCLFATTEFRNIFLSHKYEKYMDHDIPTNQRLSKSFNMLFKKMYMNGGCSVVPTGFLKTCNILRPDLRIPDDQQDTQEFLMLILDRLHDELSNQHEVKLDYPDLVDYDVDDMEVQPGQYIKWYNESVKSNGLSPIDHVFQGQTEDGLVCQRCGCSSFTYSTFYILSLAIPKASTNAFGKIKRVNLEDCIKMFTNDEILSDENAWDCPRCGSAAPKQEPIHRHREKKHIHDISPPPRSPSSPEPRSKRFFLLNAPREVVRSYSPLRILPGGRHSFDKPRELKEHYSRSADENLSDDKENQNHTTPNGRAGRVRHYSGKMVTIKSVNFVKAPRILVIHLSRFYYDLTKKNNTVITYPLHLNISLKNGEVARYKLYGLVNHTGTLVSGHYTSLVNKDTDHELGSEKQKWFYFDDEIVKEEKNHGDIEGGVTSISSSHVYVLFYQRIK
ncbi:hypothetical protein TBLA_0E01760 [Henningerozyma blattae CBS 6284]|uniref:ubiquitinyl hydrolase 1 n=1 Tax=Henningerozyma blattae (strain ATCC 34711 / CBS 6284 / DSM 70876 / NBRC 10599 / NRRL Y-10934 / UCD 77-7) TaxID=1071380 RepID=I2H4D0_HENB6|nr:hypothetical protein TBLA_0E01760 [Tetrapisispora blattae CBS 6284]CCH61232.1 hypothetical protein TBLA_0E01760 [Tetrapisispora blattae CBS 6284]